MVNIGPRPIIWHVMKYYAYFGHTDFILCLGYRGDMIKNYFLKYDECLSNDFVLSQGGKEVRLYGRDIADWTITFADTGQHSNIGQRLKAVEKYLDGEEMFLANYTDGLSDAPLDRYLDEYRKQGKIGGVLCVRPSYSFHLLSLTDRGEVDGITHMAASDLWLNGGFFAFRRDIFAYMKDGEELVQEPFRRLIADNELIAYRHEGFWACMDTLKDKQLFDDMHARGERPWEVWSRDRGVGREPEIPTVPAPSGPTRAAEFSRRVAG
jgi:glucose-1-phosphate cytidylyltransferase